MTPQLTQIILAVDALNSWVRSESIKHQWHYSAQAFKRSLYFFKKAAIKRAHEEGAVWARGIRTQAQCNRCGGSGIFVDWEGETRGRCRGCAGTGTATLRFLETRIDLGDKTLTWHHPEDGHGGLSTSLGYHLGSVLVHDWKPNTPGKDLPHLDALKLVNQVEHFFVDRPADYWGEDIGEGRYNDFLYSWPLGRAPFFGERCEFCGETNQDLLQGYCVCRHMFEWTGLACKRCDTEPGSGKIFERFEIRPEKLSPELIEWQHRHAEFYNAKLSSKDSWNGYGIGKKQPIPLL